MTKLDKLSQVEHLYVYENQPLDIIGAKFDLSRRTLFYWKKEYNWDKKRFDAEYNKDRFSEELLEFARNLIQKYHIDLMIRPKQ